MVRVLCRALRDDFEERRQMRQQALGAQGSTEAGKPLADALLQQVVVAVVGAPEGGRERRQQAREADGAGLARGLLTRFVEDCEIREQVDHALGGFPELFRLLGRAVHATAVFDALAPLEGLRGHRAATVHGLVHELRVGLVLEGRGLRPGHREGPAGRVVREDLRLLGLVHDAWKGLREPVRDVVPELVGPCADSHRQSSRAISPQGWDVVRHLLKP
mmetsp:Transcript_30683/g.77535  ORF Transcript_30683/g.77535 Transcript_30683/m.77535 type:complete len:218 (+) Transcript_30683:304-957(+)